MEGTNQKEITGIVEDHLVTVGGFAGINVNGDTVEISFTNSAAPFGHSVVCIPGERLAMMLGDLNARFMARAGAGGKEQGEKIPAADLLYIEEAGKDFRFVFADVDDETVTIALPLASAAAWLGQDLRRDLLARGALMRRVLLKLINDAREQGSL